MTTLQYRALTSLVHIASEHQCYTLLFLCYTDGDHKNVYWFILLTLTVRCLCSSRTLAVLIDHNVQCQREIGLQRRPLHDQHFVSLVDRLRRRFQQFRPGYTAS